jgi:hypothetical protein
MCSDVGYTHKFARLIWWLEFRIPPELISSSGTNS